MDEVSSLLESTERPEWNLDQQVLGSSSVSLLVINHLGGVDVDHLQVILESSLGLVLLQLLDDLSDLLLESGSLAVLLLDDSVRLVLTLIEHLIQTMIGMKSF